MVTTLTRFSRLPASVLLIAQSKSITTLANPGDKLQAGYYNIWVITVDGTQAWQLTNSELSRSVPVWSLDSRKLAFTEGPNSMLVEIEVDTQSRREIIPATPRYQPNGNGIGYIMAGGGLAWVDTTGGIHTLVPTVTLPMSTTVHDFDWMPNGQHVVYTLADESERHRPTTLGIKYSVWIVQASSLATTKLTGPSFGDPHNLQVSPDGRVVAAKVGSGFYDAGMVDLYRAFLYLAPDFKSAQVVTVEHFQGRPNKGDFYPVSDARWISSRLVLARFSIAGFPPTAVDKEGTYLIDPIARRMVQITH